MEDLVYGSVQLLPVISAIIGIITIVVGASKVLSAHPWKPISLGVSLLFLGVVCLPFTRQSFRMDQLIVFGNLGMIVFFVSAATIYASRNRFARKAEPVIRETPIMATELKGKITDEMNDLIIQEFDRLQVRTKLEKYFAQLDLEEPQAKLFLDYLLIKTSDGAIQKVNRRIQAFTGTLTLIGAILGAFALFSFFNLSELRSDANKVLEKIEIRSRALTNDLEELDGEVKKFQQGIENQQDKIIGKLIKDTETKWRTQLGQKVEEEINHQVSNASKDIITQIGEDAKAALDYGNEISKLRTRLEGIDKRIKELRSASGPYAQKPKTDQ